MPTKKHTPPPHAQKKHPLAPPAQPTAVAQRPSVNTVLLPGQTRSHPPHGKAQAHPGVHPLDPLTSSQAFQALPKPLGQPPYHYELEAVIPGITALATKQGSLVFHCVGDTGGINNPAFQTAVADAMKADLALPADELPRFF